MRRFKSSRNKFEPNSQINLTNLVDVALTVLIMFILVAPLIENGVAVNLPEASPSNLDLRDTVTITLTKDGGIHLGERKMGVNELGQTLRAMVIADPMVPVNILGDAKVEYQDLVSVLDVVRRAGVVNIGLPTEVKVARK